MKWLYVHVVSLTQQQMGIKERLRKDILPSWRRSFRFSNNA